MLEVFAAVFGATLLAQLCTWIIERYIKHRMNKVADTLEERLRQVFQKNTEEKMVKIELDIEKGSNGGYVVTWYKNLPNMIQKLGGTKPEVETLAFSSSKQIVDWLDAVQK